MRASRPTMAPPKLDHERRGRLVASVPLRVPRLIALLLALLLATATAAAPAAAQAPPPTAPPATGVAISPSTLENDLSSRAFATTVTLVNHEREPRRITLSITGLGQDVDGGPEFVVPSPVADLLRLDVSEFVLAPEERREVRVSGDLPSGDAGLYAAVVAEHAPLEEASGGSVAIRTRVASLFLLRAPRPWRESLEVVGVGVRAIGPPGAPLEVFGILKNTGNVHVRPTGTARLVKDGVLLATVPLAGGVVLPGYARRLSGSWTPPPDLTGAVTVEIDVRDPAAQGRGEASFNASVPEAPAAVIKELRAQAQGGPTVTLVLENTGTVPLDPTVTLTATEDGVERARVVLPVGALATGASKPLEWKPELADGIYLIRAVARNGDTVLAEATAGLQVGAGAGGSGGGAASASAGRNLTPVIAVAVVLLVVVVALLVLAARRRNEADARPPLQ